MLTTQEAQELIKELKMLTSNKNIYFPSPGEKQKLNLKDNNENKYNIDINRSKVKPKKVTYQTRLKLNNVVLLRVDIGGPPHINPDEEEIPSPHVHIYREGDGTKWAFNLDKFMQTKEEDLIQVLIDYLEYNNVGNRTDISVQGSSLDDSLF